MKLLSSTFICCFLSCQNFSKRNLKFFFSCFKTGHCCECQAKSTKCMKYKGLKSLLPLSFFLACKTGSWSSPGCRKRYTVWPTGCSPVFLESQFLLPWRRPRNSLETTGEGCLSAHSTTSGDLACHAMGLGGHCSKLKLINGHFWYVCLQDQVEESSELWKIIKRKDVSFHRVYIYHE